MTMIDELTLESIEDIEDICDVEDFSDTHGICIQDLDTVDECKERFRLHYHKLHNVVSRKTKIEKAMLQAGRDDAQKREKLIAYMNEMLEILRKQGPDRDLRRDSKFLDELLKTEGTSLDLEHDCHVRTRNLSDGECLVIVAGETSAGKSSVLNLFFEDDILPVHNNSSTSVITIVRYHKRKHARVVYKSGEPDKVFDLDKQGILDLNSIAFMKNASEREFHNVKEVQVYLPLPILQSGLVLVDTPGIGENEFLENELINFIDKHTVLGFIYIIKTDNAGGVQEDRILNLLRIVIQNERSKHDAGNKTGRKFDPRAALFVCNRFDLINKAEVDTVKRNALDKLASCWPSFDESQVVFFSTGRAQRDVQADMDYINDNYRDLLENLRYMFVTALETRIKASYKWMENILKRTTHHLRTMVRRLDSSDIDLEDKCEKVAQKLTGLRHRSDTVIQEVTDELEHKRHDLYTLVRNFVDSPHCKLKMTTGWDVEEIPRVDNGLGGWPWIKGKIMDKFYDRLLNLVGDWDRDEGNINRMEDSIANRVKFDLSLLEIELEDIERELQSDSSSSDSSEKPYSLSASKRRQSSFGSSPTKTKLFAVSEAKLPMKLGGRMMKPLFGLVTAIKNSKKEGEYKKNPSKVVLECVNELYDEMMKEKQSPESVLSCFVDFLLDRPRDYIAAIERKVPDMILSNQLILNRFQKSLETERAHLMEYEEMMTQTEVLRRSLSEYGEGYIFVEDFARNELRILRSGMDGDPVSVPFNVTDFLRGSSSDLEVTRQRDMRGLWTVLYGGQLVRSGVERGVTIRVYLPSSGVDFTYKEVAKLRCLSWQYTNIAEFLGIHNANTKNPSIVYDGGLKSVRKMLGSFCNKRDCVPLILEGTAAGLEYLHRKGLVHMELTQDTVTVDEIGVAQLTGACLPRFATLPEEIESTEIGKFVCLAPEVLRGDVYSSCADIYSFGLLVLELTTVDAAIVFKDQRHMTFCDFERKVDPEQMMDLDKLINVFTIRTRALIQSCLLLNKTERPAASEVAEYATYIRSEEEALMRLPNRRSRGIVKRFPSLSISTKM